MSGTGSSDMCLYILAVFLPPVAVTLKCGCGTDSLVNGLLALLAWFPAVIHAFWCISQQCEREDEKRFFAATRPTFYPPPGPPSDTEPLDPPSYTPPMREVSVNGQ